MPLRLRRARFVFICCCYFWRATGLSSRRTGLTCVLCVALRTTADEARLLRDTNQLLASIPSAQNNQLPPIKTVVELKEIASSMFVAIYEAVFAERLDLVNREPRTAADYTSNAQLVLDGLQKRLSPFGYAIPRGLTGDSVRMVRWLATGSGDPSLTCVYPAMMMWGLLVRAMCAGGVPSHPLPRVGVHGDEQSDAEHV
jgi:hypothetical protein